MAKTRSASKNKGMQKGAIKATVKDLTERFKTAVATIRKDQTSFREEWASKFNTLLVNFDNLHERFKKIVVATGQQLAQLSANQQIHSDVIEKLDVNIQAVARLGIETFGRFEQIDHHLKKSGVEYSDLSQDDLAAIKKKAQESYEATMAECFKVVHEQRQAAIDERRAAADAAKKKAEEDAEKQKTDASEAEEMAKKEAVDAKETAVAEEALQDAENPNKLSANPGGQGSDIPADAEVFGG